MLKKFLKNEKGSAMVLSLMVLMVLSVLGVALGTVTVGSFRLSDNSRDLNSAYYIAEAGANMAYEEIKGYTAEAYDVSNSSSIFFEKMNYPLNLNNIKTNEKEYDEFADQQGNQPVAKVSIKPISNEGDTKTYTIESVGKVGENTRTVTKEYQLTYNEKNTGNGTITLPSGAENAAIIARDSFKFSGGKITGDVIINSSEEEAVQITNKGNSNKIDGEILVNSQGTGQWHIYENFFKSLETKIDEIVLPEGDETYNSSLDENNKKKSLTGNGEPVVLESLSIDNNETLSIYTNNQPFNLIVNNLEISNGGKVEIIGTGDLNIYYFGSSTLNLKNNSFKGNLFVKEADIIFEGSGSIDGVLLTGGDNVKISNGSKNNAVIIAPKSKSTVNISGNNVNGSIIAGNINMTGGKVNHKQLQPEIILPGSGTTETEVSGDDLISSKPAIEE